MSWRILSLNLDTEEDIVFARQRARHIAAELGFELQDQTRIATTVSEIGRNAVSYAKGGRAEFALDADTTPQSLVVTIKDSGTGIADLSSILEGRYRSQTGMGKGIVGARRLMDGFDIKSGGKGTTVTFSKMLPRHARPFARDALPRVAQKLAAHQASPLQELREQNRELMLSLEELTARSDELNQLASELESTNRGVVALHSELESTAQELRRASDLKTRFLSNMSHEFRTPLNSILALTRLLSARTDGDLSTEQERQVKYISDAASGLLELVNDLLDIAKVEAGKIDVKPQRFMISDLFGALRGLLRPLKVNEGVELIFEEPVGVPVMFNDEAKITQILRNFISNALKFTQAGEVRVSASFKEPGSVLFEVSDTGIGIPKEYHDRIFEEFEQVPGAQQIGTKGTGLGLPLSRKFAELLHGHVAVDSEPGRGSTFFLEVPARWTAEGDAPVFYTLERKDTRPRVLIADDDEAFRYVMRRMVDAQKYEILEATDGDAALSIATSTRPDVIILDLSMPRRDGYAVLDQLAKYPHTKAIPVIVSSSLVLSDRDRARLAHSHAILSKSNLSTELLGVVLSDALQSPRAQP